MKLILLLSIIAYGYADKLDRAYLPPPNAASSGGSPGSLTAPEVQPFGQGLPVSDRQLGLNGFRKSVSSQNALFENAQTSTGPPSIGSTFHKSSDDNSAVPSFGNGYGTSTKISASPGSNNLSPSSIHQFSSNGFSDSNQNLPSAGGQSTSGSYNQGFGQGAQVLNGNTQVYNQERPQAVAERNAETLKYINENNGDSYSYSYETSNGISAEESGVAINGVMAQGGYAYTGDDGKVYSVSYTANENGYLPQGEHLPTPHPIPEEILKSIEENAKAAAAGTQEGAYRPEEYESEFSQQPYNIGSGNSYQRKPGQEQNQGPSPNPTKNNQYQPTNQGIREQNLPIDRLSQNSLVNQQFNKDTLSGQEFNRPNQEDIQQKNQGFLQESSQIYRPKPSQSQAQNVYNGQLNNLSSNRGSTTQNVGQLSQSQGNGYQYNQPQNAFQPTTLIQSSVNQYRPPSSTQGQNTFSSVPGSGVAFKGNQDKLKPSFGNRPSTDLFGSQPVQSQIGLGQQSTSVIKPFPDSGLNRPQNQIPSFSRQGQDNLNNQPFSFQQGKPTGQGYQYPKQPSLGFNKPGIINNSGSRDSNNPSFNSHNNQKQGLQSSFYESSSIPSQNSQIFNGNQNSAPVNNQAGQSPRFSQNVNKPSFNYNQSSNQISQYQQSAKQPSFGNRQPDQGSPLPSVGQGFLNNNNFGPGPSVSSKPAQAPYQYNKPSQSYTTQAPNFLPLDSQSSKVKPGQENQNMSEEFEGPRQPPSFSSQEGYKY